MTATAESLEQDTAVSEQVLQIVEYKPTAAALSTLRERYAGVIYDVSTTKGMKDAKEARKEVKGYRTSLENKRKEIKAPALQRCRDIDEEAKVITAELRKLEDPIDEQIKAEEQRKQREKEEVERRERERVDKIRADIEYIRLTPGNLIGQASAALNAAMHDLRMEPIGENRFAEFTQEALAAKQQAMQQLASMIDAARAQEELAEIKRKQAEAEAAQEEDAQKAQEAEDASHLDYHKPIDTSRIAAAADGYQPTIPAEDMAEVGDLIEQHQTGADSILADMRTDLISNAGLFSSDADAVIEAVRAGLIRHMTITE